MLPLSKFFEGDESREFVKCCFWARTEEIKLDLVESPPVRVLDLKREFVRGIRSYLDFKERLCVGNKLEDGYSEEFDKSLFVKFIDVVVSDLLAG